MTMMQKLNILAAYKSISQAEIARLVGSTPQNFHQKAKRETFTRQELEKIAEVLEVTYNSFFELPDGTKI